MKLIKLDKIEYPYSDYYTRAYIHADKTGRNMLLLVGPDKRLTTAYARYLMAVKLGRFLTKDETVDHIDNNHSNDSIDNLQILSLEDNIRKTPHKKEERHGTYAQYKRGCRCHLCVQYNLERQRKWRAENPDKVRASKNKSKTTGSINKICKQCGKAFNVHNWEARRIFCSQSCASSYQARNRTKT